MSGALYTYAGDNVAQGLAACFWTSVAFVIMSGECRMRTPRTLRSAAQPSNDRRVDSLWDARKKHAVQSMACIRLSTFFLC